MIKIDAEFKALIPPLTAEEFEQLKNNIIAEGIREPIIVWQVPHKCCGNDEIWEDEYQNRYCNNCKAEWNAHAILIDGHNRFEIAEKYNIKFETTSKYFDSREQVIDWMINNQLGRRNLTKETQSYLRGLQYQREKKKKEDNLKQNTQEIPKLQNDVSENTAQKLAEQHNVSKATIERDAVYSKAVDIIVENTMPEIKNKILNKEINITKDETQKLAKMEPEKQKEIIVTAIEKNVPIKKAIQEINRENVKKTIQEAPIQESKSIDIYNPPYKYRVLMADPPWSYGNTMPEYFTEQADHYTLMSLKQICELPVKELAEDNAVLFLWVTSPILEESFEVIKSWGFKYKSSFVWDKVKHNMGHYNSVRHELLLVCTRGSCQPDVQKLFDSVQSIERTEHSAKPEQFRDIIDTIYPLGKRIELFSRKITEGWDSFGNEI